ncbi:alpha/beta hydrolase [Parafannyhessea umbonata]|uniref:alpha/beta hydrolase n=1 Tax=Parafannyhessea umbonata TaxID=604330 RepID=UPI00359C4696
MEQLNLTQEWDKVFPKSDKVEHGKVTFHNRYGITLAADAYMPKNAEGKLPAIAVSGPFGAVKEQSSGLYAQKMAELGFFTIAFDPSYTGESGGTPRYVASPDINTEDFCAAYRGLQKRQLRAGGRRGRSAAGGRAAVREGLLRLLQDPVRLPSPQPELQRRLEFDVLAVVFEYADPAVRRRDPLRRAIGARREGALPLFQRNRVQQTDRGQQGIAYHPRCQPHRPLRSDGRHSVCKAGRVLWGVFEVRRTLIQYQAPSNDSFSHGHSIRLLTCGNAQVGIAILAI